MYTDFHFAFCASGIGASVCDCLHDAGKLFAQEHTHDCGRRFVCAETMVVGRGRNRNAQQILMRVNRRDDRRKYKQKLRIVLRTFAGVEKVARIRRNRPVVVFAASVYAVERLFVKKAGHIVLCRNLFHDFHCELVLVGGNVDGGEDRRKFVLSGSNFVVFGFAKMPSFQSSSSSSFIYLTTRGLIAPK